MPFLRRHWPVLTLVLLPLTVLWRCVFLGETIGPWDQIMQMAPWNGPKPTSAWDVLQADGVLQFYPWRDLVFDAWGKGHFPLWNPYQLCGTPLLANSQSAGFYPLHILMGVLHVPTSVAITLLAWFHLAWACLGARFLAKQYGAGEYGALVAGACFGLSAFMVSWTPLASVVTTCAWIPWVIAFGKRLLSGPPPSPDEQKMEDSGSDIPAFVASAGRSQSSSGGAMTQTALLALSCAMMLLGGHLQFAAYGLMGLVTVALVDGIQEKAKLASWGGLVAAIALGGMLAAPQVLPALAFSRDSHRQVGPTPEGAKAYVDSAIGLPELTGFAEPAQPGLPGKGVSAPGGETLPSYWPTYVKRGATFAEGAIGIGPLVLSLLFFAKRKSWGRAAGAVALTLLGILLAFGPLSLLLYWVLPGWSATGSPGRAEILLILGFCIAAGSFWPRSLPPRGHLAPLLVSGICIVGLPVLALVLKGSMTPWLPGLPSAADISALYAPPVPTVVTVIGIGCALTLIREKPLMGVILGLATFLLTGPLFCLPSGKILPFQHNLDLTARVGFVNSNWGLFQAASALMPGNAATTARIHDVAGYDSLLSKDTLEMLRSVNAGRDPAPDANGNMMFVKPRFDIATLQAAGVTEVWSLRPLPDTQLQPEQRGNLLIYRIGGPGRVFVTSSTLEARPAQITLDSTDRQVVRAMGPGNLVVKDRNMPGWTATIDGKPSDIKPGLWREIDIPAGEHEVDFRYSPPGLINGVFTAMVSALTIALLLVLDRKRRRSVQD